MEKAPNEVPPATLGSSPRLIVTPVVSALGAAPAAPLDGARGKPAEDAMKCERCGADMYRMHAVWRCPHCRYKTDCSGW